MSIQLDNEDAAEVERELTRSLNRCRRLLFDYRSQLAANSNMPELLDDNYQEPFAKLVR